MSTYARGLMRKASLTFHGWEGTREYRTNRVRLPGLGDLWATVHPPYQGGAWCAAADVGAYLKVGVDLRKLVTNPYYCPNLEQLARRNGWWKTSGAAEGDLVLYGTSLASHTGVAHPQAGALYYAHEGNTSSGNAGSQADGDGVFHRGRNRSWIRGWVDMEKVIDYMTRTGLHKPTVVAKVIKAPPKKAKAAPKLLAVDGTLGPATVRLLQHLIFTAGDGEMGPNTHRALQRWLKVSVDGQLGPITVRALQRRVGVRADGAWGPATTAALQRYLNRGILAGKVRP